MAFFTAAVLCVLTAICPVAVAEDLSEDGTNEPAGAEAEGSRSPSDSMKELQEKLGILKQLIDQRGEKEGDNPQLQEQLQKLEKQLEGLGISMKEHEAAGDADTEEIGKLLRACVLLSLRRAGGQQKPSTTAGLRRLGDPTLSRKDAANSDVGRMIVTCANELKTHQLEQFNAGSLQLLPKEIVTKATAPEAIEQVEQLDKDIWVHIQATAKVMVDNFQEEMRSSKDLSTSNYVGLFALIPVAIILLFMGKKFLDMQQRQGSKKEKSSAKKRR
jgi:hypothetical protein